MNSTKGNYSEINEIRKNHYWLRMQQYWYISNIHLTSGYLLLPCLS